MRPHDLRHTHVALLISAGEDPSVIPQRLGHASIRTTYDVYGPPCSKAATARPPTPSKPPEPGPSRTRSRRQGTSLDL